MLAGVCTGVANHMDIDPVIIRVVTVVLALTGPVGWVAYAAGWLLIPSDDETHSIAARTLNAQRHESQLLTIGFIGVLIVTAGWILSIPSGWSNPFAWAWPWIILAGIIWLVVAKPWNNQPGRDEPATDNPAAASAVSDSTVADNRVADSTGSDWGPPAPTVQQPRPVRRPHSPVLAGVTLLAVMIALSVTWLWDQLRAPVPVSAYVLVALSVVTLGVLIGVWFGDAGLLIVLGVVLSSVLAVSLLPRPGVGEVHVMPSHVSDVETSYKNGVGEVVVDLSDLRDPDKLGGRSISIRQGVGRTHVIVPDEVPVRASGHVNIGRTNLFGSSQSGSRIDAHRNTGNTTDPALTLKIHQSIGEIEVTRQ